MSSKQQQVFIAPSRRGGAGRAAKPPPLGGSIHGSRASRSSAKSTGRSGDCNRGQEPSATQIETHIAAVKAGLFRVLLGLVRESPHDALVSQAQQPLAREEFIAGIVYFTEIFVEGTLVRL